MSTHPGENDPSKQTELVFLLEIPKEISQVERERLLNAFELEQEDLLVFEQEDRTWESIPTLVEIAVVFGVVDKSIDWVLTTGVEWADRKKKAIDKAAKIIYEWRHSGNQEGKADINIIPAKNRHKKIKLDSTDKGNISKLTEEK